MRIDTTIGMMAAVAGLWACGAAAQETPSEEVLADPAAQTSSGPEWWVFSRGDTRAYLIEANSVSRTSDELTVTIARVPRHTPAGDYTHTIDQFGIRCQARQSHVVTTADALEDGAPGEPFATDEPWEAIGRGSLDDAIRQITCDDMRPQPPSYADVKAYIDAGRP